jgi:hypothetical protein
VLQLAVESTISRSVTGPEHLVVRLLRIKERLEREVTVLEQVTRRLGQNLDVADEALRVLGRLTLITGSEAVALRDATVHLGAGAGAVERRHLGLQSLERVDVIAMKEAHGRAFVEFRHSLWLAYAGGLGLPLAEIDTWVMILRFDPSTTALRAFAVAVRASDASGSELLDQLTAALRAGGVLDAGESTPLRVVTAMYEALTPVAPELEKDVRWTALLEDSWGSAEDDARLDVLSVLDLDAGPPCLLTFLWNQAVLTPPGVASRTSRLVRLAICQHLARSGASAWTALGAHWVRTVDEGLRGDLSAGGRGKRHWRAYGSQIAHLLWLLPALSATCRRQGVPGPGRLLNRLERAVCRPCEAYEGTDQPDVGLEISLAEGYKMAAIWRISAAPHEVDAGVSTDARVWTSRDKWSSWYSEVLSLHTFSLVADPAGDRARRSVLLGVARDRSAHPFVRETARLLARSRGRTAARAADVWIDEDVVRSSIGSGLSPAAHNLLAAITLLANFPDDVGVRDQAVRHRAFTARRLPRCFSRFGYSSTLQDVPCSCEFGLCGEKVSGLSPRTFSHSYLQRAAATANTLSAVRLRGLTRRGLATTWRRLHRELGSPEKDAKGAPALVSVA